MSKGINQVFWYGTKNGEICGDIKISEPFLEVNVTKGTLFKTVSTQLVGDYNLPNVLCAIMVGKHFNVPGEKIKSAIENYIPSNSRSQLLEIGTNKIILDAYNANPSSMKVAIENFAHVHAKNKILILGGMMELGDESIQEHKNLLALINQYKWKKVILVGGDFKNTGLSETFFNSADEARVWLEQQNFQQTYFLIKGSRSIQLEKILPAFQISQS